MVVGLELRTASLVSILSLGQHSGIVQDRPQFLLTRLAVEKGQIRQYGRRNRTPSPGRDVVPDAGADFFGDALALKRKEAAGAQYSSTIRKAKGCRLAPLAMLVMTPVK